MSKLKQNKLNLNKKVPNKSQTNKQKFLTTKDISLMAVLVSIGFVLSLLRFAFPPLIVWANPELPLIPVLIAAFIFNRYFLVLIVALLIWPVYFFIDMNRGMVNLTTILSVFLDYLIPLLLCSFMFFLRSYFYKKSWLIIPVYLFISLLIFACHTISGIVNYHVPLIPSMAINWALIPNTWVIAILVSWYLFKIIKAKDIYQFKAKDIKLTNQADNLPLS